MKKYFLCALLMMLTSVQALVAWDGGGSGTSSDPYLISDATAWRNLYVEVVSGNTFSGKYFRLTNDINVGTQSIGLENKPFSGTFDGDGHTLTFAGGGSTATDFVVISDYCAPFVRLDGATIRHLNVTGEVYTSHKFAAGIASIINGSEPTTIMDCHVSSKLYADNSLASDATFGGLVGDIASTVIRTGASIAKSASGELSVSVVSGYEFYLVKSERK